jgi:hypothetical protein
VLGLEYVVLEKEDMRNVFFARAVICFLYSAYIIRIFKFSTKKISLLCRVAILFTPASMLLCMYKVDSDKNLAVFYLALRTKVFNN